MSKGRRHMKKRAKTGRMTVSDSDLDSPASSEKRLEVAALHIPRLLAWTKRTERNTKNAIPVTIQNVVYWNLR